MLASQQREADRQAAERREAEYLADQRRQEVLNQEIEQAANLFAASQEQAKRGPTPHSSSGNGGRSFTDRHGERGPSQPEEPPRLSPHERVLQEDNLNLARDLHKQKVEFELLKKQFGALAEVKDDQNKFLQQVNRVMQQVPVAPAVAAAAPVTPKKTEQKPPIYKAGLDWKIYAQTFTEVAAYNKWSDPTAAIRMRFAIDPKELETAVHVDPSISHTYVYDDLVLKLAAIFGEAYQEGTAKTEYDGRYKLSTESYQTYMLDLMKLYNQAWPQHNIAVRDESLADKFMYSLSDLEMTKYLKNAGERRPSALVRLAESQRCMEKEMLLRHAMVEKAKEADAENLYAAYKDGAGKPQGRPWYRKDAEKASVPADGRIDEILTKLSVLPTDLRKTMKEDVCQEMGARLTQENLKKILEPSTPQTKNRRRRQRKRGNSNPKTGNSQPVNTAQAATQPGATDQPPSGN